MNIFMNWLFMLNKSVVFILENNFFNVIVFLDVMFCVFLVFGNFFILLLICKKCFLGRFMNVFIFFIVVVDFLNGLIVIFIYIMFFYYREMIYLCKCFWFVSYLIKIVVFYIIVFMMVEKIM